MAKLSLFIYLLFIALSACAQDDHDSLVDFNKKFTVAELKKDLAILKDSLTDIHPALYRYTSKHKLDSAFRITDRMIDRPLTQPQFYHLAAPIISMVGDIHTTIEPPDEYFHYLATKGYLFPFDIRITNNTVFIASNNSGTSIPVGSKILKINHQPIDRILSKMKSFFSGEGTNTTMKLKLIEQRFAFHYHLTYGYSKHFELEYAVGNKPAKKARVSARSFPVITKQRAVNQLNHPRLRSLFPQPPYLSLSINKEMNTATMTIFQSTLAGIDEDAAYTIKLIDKAK